MPDDVISAATLLVTVIDQAVQNGVDLPCAQKATEALTAAIAEAKAELADARTALTDRQDAAAEVRRTAQVAHAQLVVLRRILLASVGRSDLDYQVLRATRGASNEDDDSDESVVPVPETATAPEAGTIATDDTVETDSDRESGEFEATAVAS